MGNPTTTVGLTNISDVPPGDNGTIAFRWVTCVAANNAIATVALDAKKGYTISHDSQDETGASDTNTVYFACSGNPITNPQSADGKLKLINGRSVFIGPGIPSISFRCAAGSPTFTLIPDSHAYGQM